MKVCNPYGKGSRGTRLHPFSATSRSYLIGTTFSHSCLIGQLTSKTVPQGVTRNNVARYPSPRVASVGRLKPFEDGHRTHSVGRRVRGSRQCTRTPGTRVNLHSFFSSVLGVFEAEDGFEAP